MGQPGAGHTAGVTILPADNHLGDGRIDNFIVDSSVHLTTGILVLVTMTAATLLVGRHAVRGEALNRSSLLVMVVAQIVLIAQILLGIKLLDQGQGIVQLYIHYVGGLIPMGAFLLGGWVARGDSPRSSRILFGLLVIGYVSALMAFFIGRSFANA